MSVYGHVFVQGVKVVPAALLAHELQDGRHCEVPGAGRRGVGHDQAAAILRGDEVPIRPGHNNAQPVHFNGVAHETGHPRLDAHPVRLLVAIVIEPGLDRVQPVRAVAFEHARVITRHEAGERQAPHHVGLGIVLLGQELGADHARGVPHHIQLNFGMRFFECPEINGQFIVLQGRVYHKSIAGHVFRTPAQCETQPREAEEDKGCGNQTPKGNSGRQGRAPWASMASMRSTMRGQWSMPSVT